MSMVKFTHVGAGILLLIGPVAGCGTPDGGRSGESVSDAAIPDAQMLTLPDVDAGLVIETVCEIIETERCDGIDNDCDDKVDEDFSIGEMCVVEIPDCRSEGTWVCGADESKAVCDAPAFTSEDEVCDGTDNDCDGEVDEGFDLVNDPTHCGLCGQTCAFENARADCARSSCILLSCEPGWVNQNADDADGCECRLTNNSTEACDGLDNDCNGQIDEGFQLGTTCTAGVGACTAEGMTICGEDKAATCDATPSAPGTEACNGIDDDCDGEIDEDFDQDDDGFVRCPELDCTRCAAGDDCEPLCAQVDCDDNNPAIYPAAPEICGDDEDQNCDMRDAVCEVHLGRIDTFGIVRADEEGCPDLTGDGQPNNAFATVSGILNGLLETDLNEGRINLIAMFYGIASADEEGLFDFGLGYAVNNQLTDESVGEDGRPSVLFPSARIDRGQLTAGPRDTDIPLPVPGALVVITARQALITGTVTLPFEDPDTGRLGVRVENGLLSAVAPLSVLRETVEEYEPMLLFFVNALDPDIDLDGDGVNESLSLCARFTIKPPAEDIGQIPPPLGAIPR
ncbi:MAG: putative metal-binding motif-containing protein [Myxococcota bacterium]|nr:putative metal-binding motif-containing protein [Myxococcota bacterium]